MDLFILVNSAKTSYKDLEFTHGQMDASLKASGRTTRWMVLGCLVGLTRGNMLGITKLTKKKAMDYFSGLMVAVTTVFGLMVSSMVLEYTKRKWVRKKSALGLKVEELLGNLMNR